MCMKCDDINLSFLWQFVDEFIPHFNLYIPKLLKILIHYKHHIS